MSWRLDLVDAKVAGPTPRWLESYDSYLGPLAVALHPTSVKSKGGILNFDYEIRPCVRATLHLNFLKWIQIEISWNSKVQILNTTQTYIS